MFLSSCPGLQYVSTSADERLRLSVISPPKYGMTQIFVFVEKASSWRIIDVLPVEFSARRLCQMLNKH